MNNSRSIQEYNQLLKIAFILSILTVVYNIAEGLVATYFGFTDETIALFGFGIDSFVEVISGIGIGHMILRLKHIAITSRDRFERQALYITGISFYILTTGLIIGSVINIVYEVNPNTTVVGIIISLISILTMWILFRFKVKVGTELKSEPIIADANCTKTCFYLSFILLTSSLLYELFKIQYIDLIGGLGIAFFAFREGREAIEKAGSDNLSCSCDDCCS